MTDLREEVFLFKAARRPVAATGGCSFVTQGSPPSVPVTLLKAVETGAVGDVGSWTMAIFLNPRRPNPAGRIVIATCAISDAPERLYGIDRTFAEVEETANALRAADIHDHRYIMPLMAVNSGYGSFLELSENEASSLGPLVRSDG